MSGVLSQTGVLRSAESSTRIKEDLRKKRRAEKTRDREISVYEGSLLGRLEERTEQEGKRNPRERKVGRNHKEKLK